jgi:hypothetical protein
MHAIDADGERNVTARIDEQSCSQFRVFSSQLGEHLCGIPAERFQFARAKIFFTELDIVDSGAGSFTDFRKKMFTTFVFICRKLMAIRDVVEHAAFSHQLSAHGLVLAISGITSPCFFGAAPK